MAVSPSDALSQALRLFTILQLVASRRSDRCLGRTQLADACGCSAKTITRDVQELQMAGIPIEYDPSKRTYCIPSEGWNVTAIMMTPGDTMALALMRGLMADATSAFPFAHEVEMALDKVTAGLPPKLQSLLQAASNSLRDLGGMARDYSQVPIAPLLLAIARRQTIEMRYHSQSSGTIKWRFADPYRLDRREGRYLEMQAWCHERQQVSTFALDRILDLRNTGQTFERQPWNDSDVGVVGGLRGGKPVQVEVRFDVTVASYARARKWPFAAVLEEAENGSVIMRGEVLGVDGITKELLAWRRHATVLGGPELRARMIEEVRAMAALYAGEHEKT